MGRRLIDNLSTITLIVIDFEYTTPTGARPEPIEIAVQAVKIREDSLERLARISTQLVRRKGVRRTRSGGCGCSTRGRGCRGVRFGVGRGCRRGGRGAR